MVAIQEICQKTQLSPTSQPALFYYETIDSTNTTAKTLVSKTASPFFILADQQTAGKGRLNRQFLSPAGTGIYLTYTFDCPIAQLAPGLLTTSAAVVVAQAITQVFHVEPQIKWVNDLYLQTKKVCGILAETIPTTPGHVAVILGMGINLKTPTALPTALQNKVGGLNVPGNITDFCVTLLNALPQMVQTYQTGKYLSYYRQHAFLTHKRVALKIGAATTEGIVVDITDKGALILQTDAGQQIFNAGEVQKVYF